MLLSTFACGPECRHDWCADDPGCVGDALPHFASALFVNSLPNMGVPPLRNAVPTDEHIPVVQILAVEKSLIISTRQDLAWLGGQGHHDCELDRQAPEILGI